MAEAAILAALNALAGALGKELFKRATSEASDLFSTISDLETRMNYISSELRVMKQFLDQTDIHDESNKAQVAWIGEVQKLANRITDIVAEFVNLVGNQKFGGKRFYLKKNFKEPRSLVALKGIASQLQTVEGSLKHVSEMKERWVPTINSSCSRNSNEYSQHELIEEDEIVGIEENKVKLTSWIHFNEPHRSVISVWGMGGVGKTTLVNHVFERERKNFDSHAWVSISHTYTVDHLLKKLISEICGKDKTDDTATMDLRGLKKTTRDLLKEKKYLIVLDDIWDPKAFRDIHDTLADSQKGSRIIITSRIAEVAFLARESYRLELKPLPDSESWHLFCRKAFEHERNHACPPPLEKWAREIASKCDGSPLALVSIGSVLSLCEKTESEWKRFHDQLNWELENNRSFDQLRNILNLSFKYLPSYLKNCFLYCCMFPEDYLLTRKKLIRLWIAENFIERRGESTLEEVAESYLVELIHRSMLEVVKKNYSGRVQECRMHDTLRELAISLCTKENFALLHENDKPVNVDNFARRLSIIKCSNEIRHDVHLPQLRTFISFDRAVVLSSPLLSSVFRRSRYLSVLDLQGLPIETVPDAIGDLFNLQYLGLRETKVKFLPKSIKKLQNLQTLDLNCSEILKLPDGIADLERLRHLFAEAVVDKSYRSFRNRTGVDLPKSMFYPRNLQTLQALESNAMVVKELGNLTQLRTFRIRNVKENHSTDLCSSLSKMPFLSFLSVNASHENEFLHLEGLNPSPPQLQKLHLRGRLEEKVFESPLFQISGKNIQMLGLGWSQLRDDPLPALSHLENLTYLDLQRAYEGQQLVFKAGWFPKLKALVLEQMPNLVRVDMEKGTMVKLEEIYLVDLEQLVGIPKGIEHLNSLQLMYSRDMHADFGGLSPGLHELFHFKCYVVQPR